MINIYGLTKKYRKNIVLDNITMEIPNTGITFLMGENGCGKTTLIKALLNLESYEGQILFDEKPFQQGRNSVAVVYDDNPLYNSLNGLQNLILLSQITLSKIEIIEKVSPFFSERELKKKVKNYSYGQKKKLSICIAFLSSANFIVMDEVSNGLDYESMIVLKKMIKSESSEKAFFLTGHQFDFYNDIIENLLVLKNGDIYKVERLDNEMFNLGRIYEQKIMDTEKRTSASAL